jgi:hypothetical protein
MKALGRPVETALAALVAVMDDAFRPARCDGHIERVEHDTGLQVVAERPADDPTRPGVEIDGEKEEARRGWNERDVRHPEPIGSIGGEVPANQISGGGPLGCADRRGDGPAPAADAREASLSHQPGDALAPDLDALGPKLGMEARRPVGAVRDGVNGADAA